MSRRKYTVEIDPFLESRSEWHVTTNDSPNPKFTFALRFPPDWKLPIDTSALHLEAKRGWSFREADVFDVRAVVFSMKTPDDALECFRRFGPWQIADRFATKADPITWSQVQQARDFFEDALLHRSIENLNQRYEGDEVEEGFRNLYLWQPLNAELLFRQPYIELVRCWDVQMALRASIFLDRMEGFQWRRCARKDCGNLYKVTSTRERLYCKTYCAHLSNMRAKRDEERRKASAIASRKLVSRKVKAKR